MDNREYQTRAVRRLNALLNASRHPVYLAPCGTGKTYTAAALIADRISLRRRVFVIVPQVEIFDEWMRVLGDAGLNPGYINDEGIRGRDRGVYVCMALSLVGALALLPESLYPDEIITDEMQHSLAASWEMIYRFFPKALRLGLTATLYHGSLRSFEHLYTDVVQTITKSRAIADGYITKPLLVIPEDYAPNVPRRGDDFDPEAQAELLGKPAIIGNVIDYYSRTFEGRPVIIPCATYEHASLMTKEFRDAGWCMEHLHSVLPAYERKRILRAVARGANNGICTVGIGIEGMSIHGLYGVLWLRRTLSPIIWTQFNGRAERVVDGKEFYICADFVGNAVIHGLPDLDLSWTLEQQGAELEPGSRADRPVMVLCSHCGVMNAGINVICHFCGFPLDEEAIGTGRSRGIPTIRDGRLVVIDADNPPVDLEEHVAAVQERQRRTASGKPLRARSPRAAKQRCSERTYSPGAAGSFSPTR